MAYTLTLLGTDTTFAATEGYDKAETLSYISTLIPGESNDSLPTDKVATQYRNTKVAVVDGPTTLGAEVGDRIARGVQAILEAMSRGETEINIIAHSRGAVEAILVAHELERIQKLLTNPPVDRKQLTKSECKYTTGAMNGAHRDAFAQLDLEKIAVSMANIKLSLLTIDPVPGGNYMGITRLSSLAWRDPRFYRVPKIVKEYEQYTYENERTRCFKSIVPKCDSPETTSFKLCSLPGHHGTGSGNLKSQQREDVPKGTVEHVQELAIAKIIDFLTRNGVTITPRIEKDPFESLIAQLLPINKRTLNKLYLDLYTKIMANKEAYQYFNKTSYPTLGQEQGVLRMLWTPVEQRIVHYQAHNDTYLETIVPPVPGGHFLNYEHARIHLNDLLGLSDKLPLSETINQSIKQLLDISKHTTQLKDLKTAKQPEVSSDLTVSFMQDKVAPTVQTKEGFDLLLEGVGLLIEEVRRPYLQDQFVDSEEREKVYVAVNRAFTLFKEFTTHPLHLENELAKTILNTLNSGLETALETKRKTLLEQNQALLIKLEGNAFFVTLLEEIEKISKNLSENGAQGEDWKVMVQLNDFLEQAKHLESSKPPVIREFIQQFITTLNLTEVQDVGSELAKNSLILAKLLMSEAVDDGLNYDVDSIMKEVIQSNNQLEKFRKALPDFKVLYGALAYEQWDRELKEKRHHLVHLAAQYIVKEGLDLDEPFIQDLFIENKALFKEIAGLAIGLGATNPLIFDLTEVTKQKQKFSAKVEKLKEKVIKLTQGQEELTKKLSTTEEAHEGTVKQLTEKYDSVAKELAQTKKDYDLAVQELREVNEAQKQDFAEKAGDLKKQLGELTEVKQRLEEQLSQDEQEHGLQVEELIQGKDGLSKQLEALRKEHARVEQELTTANRSQKQEFTKKVEGLEKQLTELTKGQEGLTEQLAQKEKEHVKAVEELTFAKEKQREEFSTQMDVLNKQLVKLTQDQEELTKKLSTTEEAHEGTVKQLTEKYDSVAKELAQTKKDYDLAVQELREVNEAQKQEFAQKAGDLKKQLGELTEVKQRLEEQLSQDEREHGLQVEELIQGKDGLSKQLEALRKEHARVEQELTTANKSQKQEFTKKVEGLEKQLTELTKGQESLTEQLAQKEKEHVKAVEELTFAKEKQRKEFSTQMDVLNEQLVKLTEEQQQLTKKLSTTEEAHEGTVKQLTEKYDSVAKELAQTRKDYDLAVQELREVNEAQKQEFAQKAGDLKKQLGELTEVKQRLAEQLSQDEREHGLQVEELIQGKDGLSKQLEALRKEHARVEQELTTANKSQKQEFTKKVEGLEKQLTELTKGQESLTEQLAQKEKEHVKAVEELTFAKEKQRGEFSTQMDVLNKQLVKLTQDQEELTKKLSTTEEAHEGTVKQLTEKHDRVIKELAQTKKDHDLVVQELREVNEAQKQEFAQKAGDLKKQLGELTEVKQRLEEQLSQGEREHGLQVDGLIQEKDSLSKQLEALRKEHARVEQELTTANRSQKQEFTKKVEGLEKQLTELTKGQESLTEQLAQKEKEHVKAVEELTFAKEKQRKEFSTQMDVLNEQLVKLTEEQQQLTKKLSTTEEAHEGTVKQLTEKHDSVTKELAQTKKDYDRAVQELSKINEVQKQDFAEKAGELEKRLVDLTQVKQRLAEQLSQGEREHGLQVEELIQGKDSLDKQLEDLKEKYDLVVQKLSIPDEVREQEFTNKVEGLEKQLTGLTKGQEILTEQLNSSKIEHQRAIEKLNQEKDYLMGENASLNLVNQFLQDNIRILEQQKKDLQGILNNNTEMKCQSIIIDKLTPLTKDYLLHLAAEIQKSIAPTLDVKDIPGFITQINSIQNWPQDKASKILKDKFDAVSGLYRTLHDETIVKPSEKITKFYGQLNDANEVLKKHRDPNWQNFANAAVVLSIVLTGVLPGLAVLGIMALCGKSPKFWQSAGQTFFTTSKEEIAEKIPEAIMKNGITSGGS